MTQEEKLAGIALQQQNDLDIGAERASRMTNPEQTSFNLFAKPQPTQPVVTPTTPVKTTPVNTTPVNQNAQTQNPYNQITSMDDLAKAMGYTSPQEEEKLRKASVANRRILAVADAMRHIGNIYNTVRYAPAQQFNSPVLEEQSRYERGKALRDKANQVYLSYQQQKAAQDAKQRQWEAEQKAKADQWNATFKFNAAKAAADLAERQRQYNSTLGFNKEKQKATEERWNRQDEETKRYHKATTGLGYARLNETRRHNNVLESRGGGRNNTITLRGKNGFYSKNMDSNELNSFYNQTYDEMKRRGIINEGNVLAGLPADMFGNKSLSQTAIRQAVDQALIQHPEVGDWLSDEFEFDYDPRYQESGAPYAQTQQPYLGYIPEWRGGKSLGTGIGASTSNNSGMKLGLGL